MRPWLGPDFTSQVIAALLGHWIISDWASLWDGSIEIKSKLPTRWRVVMADSTCFLLSLKAHHSSVNVYLSMLNMLHSAPLLVVDKKCHTYYNEYFFLGDKGQSFISCVQRDHHLPFIPDLFNPSNTFSRCTWPFTYKVCLIQIDSIMLLMLKRVSPFCLIHLNFLTFTPIGNPVIKAIKKKKKI